MGSGFPAFFHTSSLSSLLDLNMHSMGWLSILLTGGGLLVGNWLIRLGPRRTVAYLILLLLGSVFGSFFLNALVRI